MGHVVVWLNQIVNFTKNKKVAPLTHGGPPKVKVKSSLHSRRVHKVEFYKKKLQRERVRRVGTID